MEGGDFIWLDEHHAAVGLGPRTNKEGIAQLRAILGEEVDLHIVELPAPDHPDDVLHLMSIISPLDKDLALIYRTLMPTQFIEWLEQLGIAFVDVPEAEYLPMGCNVLALGPRQVLMLENLPGVKSWVRGCRLFCDNLQRVRDQSQRRRRTHLFDSSFSARVIRLHQTLL